MPAQPVSQSAPVTPAVAAPAAVAQTANREAAIDTVKVDTRKLDGLVDMVGELVILQSLIHESPALGRVGDEKLTRNLAQLRRITTDLQRGAMSMRMVPLRTIDSLKLDRLDFLKADVEGFEFEMLSGCAQTLQRCRPVVFVESVGPGGDGRARLRDYFLSQGYQCWHYITPLFNPQNFGAWPHDEFTGICSIDMLCVPDGRARVSGLEDAGQAKTAPRTLDEWRGARFEHLPATA